MDFKAIYRNRADLMLRARDYLKYGLSALTSYRTMR